MPWSARMAALDLHRRLDLNAPTDRVMAYFADCLQAAYDAGRAEPQSDIPAPPVSAPSPDYAALCQKLTYNGAVNLRGTVQNPHARFPELVNGGERFSTGLGKWTTLAAIGVENHLKALKLAEDRRLPWHGDRRDETTLHTSLCVTDLGRAVAHYLDAHWDTLVTGFRR